jgi:hypothetical protein
MKGYDLAKEFTKYKGPCDKANCISVYAEFKETYSFLLKVPHQDIYMPSSPP